jgi:diamine N-acetyltransferase
MQFIVITAEGTETYEGSVQNALADAAEYTQAKPWYRAVYAGDEPIGFVMISWNCEPQPPGDHRAVVLVEAAH